MSFRLVRKSVTMNDLERRNSPNGCVISPNSVAFGTDYAKVRLWYTFHFVYSNIATYLLCRLYHGPPINCQILPRSAAVLTFEHLNVGRCSIGLKVTSTKKVIIFLGEEKCIPRENRGYAYEKRAPPYVGVGPRPRMVNPTLHMSYEEHVAEFMRVSIIVRDSFGSFAFHRRRELYCGLNDCLTVCFFLLFFIS